MVRWRKSHRAAQLSAKVYLSRFQKSNLGPFKESLHQGGYEFSPFDFEYLEAREYWLDFTEYLTAPEVPQSFGCGSKNRYPNGSLEGGNMDQNLRFAPPIV